MLHRIAHLIEPLLRFLWPAPGRDRQSGAPPTAAATPATRLELCSQPHASVLRGEDSPLVRPYLTAHEQREAAKQQRARRRALWLAVHGIDIGPRRIHGVEVTA
ncbi:hypothetical protein [Streptomyces sp. NBC_00658]|uniref:hypothetical protein n=1 Tax=Streptomyces sp. NBC_00658 TaxID=2975800 RepID=UPI00325631E3